MDDNRGWSRMPMPPQGGSPRGGSGGEVDTALLGRIAQLHSRVQALEARAGHLAVLIAAVEAQGPQPGAIVVPAAGGV